MTALYEGLTVEVRASADGANVEAGIVVEGAFLAFEAWQKEWVVDRIAVAKANAAAEAPAAAEPAAAPAEPASPLASS